MDRESALVLVQTHVSKRNWLYHMLAVEAIMRGLASHLGEDREMWGLLGLLHDIDFEKTESSPETHGLEAELILSGKVPEEVIRGIKAHNHDFTGVAPVSKMEKGLIAADAASGLLIASALVMPSKKIRELTVKSVMKKFKDKDFARGADRNRIMLCEEIGVEMTKFFEIALESLREVASSIGL